MKRSRIPASVRRANVAALQREFDSWSRGEPQPTPAIFTPPITMAVDPAAADLLDPTGQLRRAGQLDLSTIPVVDSPDTWTPKTRTVFFRTDLSRNRLYRKTIDVAAWGGYTIQYVSLANARLVAEWLGGSR